MPGPSGEPGVLLLVPPSEALDWDLKDEVASTARYWLAERQAWWVAKPYASTAVAIVTRLHGPPLVADDHRAEPISWTPVAGAGGWLRRLLHGARRQLRMRQHE